MTVSRALEHVSSKLQVQRLKRTMVWFILSLKFYHAARSLLHRRPGLVWIEFGHRLRNGCGLWPEVFLINDAVMVDDKGHDPGGTVLRRISHYAETAHHLTFH